MESTATCPRCGKELAHPMLFRCISCFTQYCVGCDESQEGRNCPQCGQTGRMVLDQRTPEQKKA